MLLPRQCFCCFSFRRLRQKPSFFKVEDLQPGMKGIGRTCVQGSRPEEFQVEILGVLHGTSPGVSVVLARFSGSILEKTGIFEGMSGSPVFIDGKLLGAVAYSFSFTKEAIGGITPITRDGERFQRKPGCRLPEKSCSIITCHGNTALPSPTSFAKRKVLAVTSADVQQQPLLANFRGHSLIPIATPLSLGGFHSETLRMFGPQFRSMGMSLLQGAGGSGLRT